MQIVIDIPDKLRETVVNGVPMMFEFILLCDAVRNGKPLSEDATNGDMIKVMFPNCIVEEYENSVDVIKLDGMSVFSKKWWNAPYNGRIGLTEEEQQELYGWYKSNDSWI